MPDAEFWAYLDRLAASSEVVIDRHRDTPHPDYPDMRYPLDYGYLAGTTSSDGAGIDVWIGSDDARRITGVACTVDLLKRDSEVKLLLGCSEAEMHVIADFLNDGDMRCLVVPRPGG